MPSQELNIERAIQSAITQEIAKIVADEAMKAAQRVESLVRSEAAAIAGRILTRFNMERTGTNLIITIDFNNTKT